MNPGLSCEIPTETVSTCIHGVPVKFECGICHDKHRITLLESQVKELTEMYKEIIRKDEIKEAIYNQFMRELRDHKIRQIDENRKISRRVDDVHLDLRMFDKTFDNINDRLDKLQFMEKNNHEIWKRIEKLENELKDIIPRVWSAEQKGCIAIDYIESNGKFKNKKPHKCPVCDGNGRINLKEPLITKNSTCYSISCVPCEERGIVWG